MIINNPTSIPDFISKLGIGAAALAGAGIAAPYLFKLLGLWEWEGTPPTLEFHQNMAIAGLIVNAVFKERS